MSDLNGDKGLKKEVGLYTVFGVLTTLVGILTFKWAMDFGLHYAPANVVSFIAAVSFAWITNRKYVFSSEAKSFGEIVLESIRFLGSRVLTFLLETAGLFVLIDGLHAHALLSKLVCTFVVVVLNYVLSKFYIFKKKVR